MRPWRAARVVTRQRVVVLQEDLEEVLEQATHGLSVCDLGTRELERYARLSRAVDEAIDETPPDRCGLLAVEAQIDGRTVVLRPDDISFVYAQEPRPAAATDDALGARRWHLPAFITVEAESLQEATALIYGALPVSVSSDADETKTVEIHVEPDRVPDPLVKEPRGG